MRRLEAHLGVSARRRFFDFAPDAVVHAGDPVGTVSGKRIMQDLLDPLAAAFPAGEERLDILNAGDWNGDRWTASTGHIAGIFAKPLWGIPATGHAAWLRFGRFDRWDNGRIAEIYLLFDLPDLMMQAGLWPGARPLGANRRAPPPATGDGVFMKEAPEDESARSLALVEAMIGGLMRYDRRSLASMRMIDFWTPDFWWYGPAVIGTFCGHADYERGHQGPFLAAFPDRVGGDHKCRIGDGAYVASTGWPSIRATHTGGDWLGLAPTGRGVTMRVMDFWRREGDRLSENWVFIDIPDLLRQLGIDIFARLAALQPAERRA